MSIPIVYQCRNYRPNSPPQSYSGSPSPHDGQVLADLCHPDTGEFYRTAVVADCGYWGSAVRYCDERNDRLNTGTEQLEMTEPDPFLEADPDTIRPDPDNADAYNRMRPQP